MRYLLKQQDYKKMPWKNGKGITEEIIRVNHSGGPDFLWRLSIADINENGEFSIFSGYQRIISVLEGAGMLLSIDNIWSRTLLIADPFAFSGDAKVASRLLDGKLRDFNLIYDPRFISVRLQWFNSNALVRFLSDAEQLVIFSTSGQTLQIANETVRLSGYDTLWNSVDQSGLYEVVLNAMETGGYCCVIELYTKY